MDLVTILFTVLTFALIGFIVWLIVTYIPMPAPFAQVIIVGCVIMLAFYLILLVSGSAPPIHFGGVRSGVR